MTIKLSTDLSEEEILKVISEQIVEDTGLNMWAAIERCKPIIRSCHTITAQFDKLESFEAALKERDMKVVLISDTYHIWSKDLVFQYAKNRPCAVLVQACVYMSSKTVIFRTHSRY